MSEPKTIEFQDDRLTLHIGNNTSHCFHAIWLRDNILDADARHENGQRLFDWSELPAQIAIETATIDHDNNSVKIRFIEGRETVFPINWLLEYAYDKPVSAPAYKSFGHDLDLAKLYHDYQAVMSDP
ncbi:MAG: gamma-butyrobetaine hydroxylase-like domain-containing protein, partial [Alphaproteobacteria bacterium]|nr:gamma-butyrobetaine hydroxylase-like domain-containing protein [Alphaproteobacteria bacterium]